MAKKSDHLKEQPHPISEEAPAEETVETGAAEACEGTPALEEQIGRAHV